MKVYAVKDTISGKYYGTRTYLSKYDPNVRIHMSLGAARKKAGQLRHSYYHQSIKPVIVELELVETRYVEEVKL